MRRLSLVAAIVAFFISDIARAGRTELSIGGRPFNFDPGAGYCRLEGVANPAARSRLNAAAVTLGDNAALLAMFVPCGELSGFRERKRPDFSRWGIVMTPLSGGKPLPASRYGVREFLDRLERSFSDGATPDAANPGRHAQDAVRKKFRRGNGSADIRILYGPHFLHRDSAVIYAWMRLQLQPDSENEKIIDGLFGMATVYGYLIQYNLYGPFADSEVVDIREKELSPVMNDLAESNEAAGRRLRPVPGRDGIAYDVDPSSGGSWINRVLDAGAGGLVGGVGIALVAVVLARIFRIFRQVRRRTED